MYGKPKNVALNFFIGREVIALILGKFNTTLGIGKLAVDDPDYNINFEADFSLDKQHFKREIISAESHRLYVLLGKKITSAQFIKEDKGDLKLTFDSGNELIIHEDDAPYESYTMQTPDGLVVV